MAASTVIRTLALNFTARTSNLTKGFKHVKRDALNFVTGMTRIAGRLAAFGSILAAGLGIAGVTSMVMAQMSLVDGLAKTSDQLGIATNDLAAFQMQADLSGVSAEQFSTGVSKMIRSIADAAEGSKSAAGALAALGLDPKKLQSTNVRDAFLEIAEGISKVGSAQQRLDLATQIFGRGGQGMLSMLIEGRSGFERASRDATAFGLAISRVDAAKVEQANDAMTRARAAIDGIARTAAIALSPVIERMANQFVEWAKTGTNASSLVARSLETVVNVIGVIADSFQKLSELGTRFAIVGNLIDHIFTLDFTAEAETRRMQERARLNQDLQQQIKAPRVSSDIRRWVADAKAIALEAAEATARQRSDLFERGPFGGIGSPAAAARSIQGPRGLSRGSAEAESAIARFLNRTTETPELREQRKANQHLERIDRNINDMRRDQRNDVVGIN